MSAMIKPDSKIEIYSDPLESSMHGKMEYTLMNDFLSKYSFQTNLYALQGLLGALLHIDPDTITDIEVLNPTSPGKTISDRDCILDIKLEVNETQIINIEIQSRRQDFWPERSVTYLCRNFDHLKEGQGYDQIKPCVQVGILDNDLFKKGDSRYTEEFFIEYELQSVTLHTGYTGKFQIKVLSLNHLDDASEREKITPNGLYFWAKLFKAQTWEELKMIAEDNPRMKSLVGTVRKLSAEEEVTQACEARRRYSNEIATYENEIKELQTECLMATEKLDQTTEKLDQTTEKLDQTTEKLDQTTKERDAMALEIERLKKELASLR